MLNILKYVKLVINKINDYYYKIFLLYFQKKNSYKEIVVKYCLSESPNLDNNFILHYLYAKGTNMF